MINKYQDIHSIHASSPAYEYFFHPPVTTTDFAKQHFHYLSGANEVRAAFPFFLEMTTCENHYLLIYTLEGNGSLKIDGHKYMLPPASLIFIPCSGLYRLDLCQEHYWHFKYAYISGRQVPAYHRLYMDSGSPLCIPAVEHKVEAIFDKLIRSALIPGDACELIQCELITRLLTEAIILQRHVKEAFDDTPEYIIAITKLFKEEFYASFSLDDLAKRHHVSKGKLIRDFKAYLGDSPINYLITLRLEAAKTRLCNCDEPIYEVATSVGIDNINHFNNLFKRLTGLTPAAYRKSNRSEIAKLRV